MTSKVTLQGRVRTVTFANEQTGYRVLKVEDGNHVRTVVGVMPGVSPGMTVRVVGELVDDPRFGAQIKADSVAVVTPRTLEGLEDFLASGIVKGIGPGLAKRIVQTFGERSWEVLDHGSKELAMVRGISKDLAERVHAGWFEHKIEAAIFAHLAGFGVTPALAKRVVRTYGAAAPHVIEKQPYRLSTEVRGIAFLTADRIAQAGGIPRDAPERIDAGLVHVLTEVAREGHTITDEREAVRAAADVLGLADELLDGAVDRVVAAGLAVRDRDGALSPRPLAEAEESLAVRISVLQKSRARPVPNPELALAEIERGLGLALAPQQREAVLTAARSKVSVVTGGPGVGKTTIVKAMVRLFAKHRLVVRLAAPTGRAAKRLAESTGIEARTLHRLLEVDPKTGGFTRGVANPCEGDVFVVDETSMLDVTLGRSLFEAVPDEARVVVVGDADQLPSIGPGAVLDDLVSSGVVPVTRLSTIFRQGKGSLITEAAHAVLAGRVPEGGSQPGDDFFVLERRDPAAVLETLLALVKKRIPERLGVDAKRDVQVLVPMRKRALGADELNQHLADALNPGAVRDARGFGVGDKVIQTKNDYDLDVYNGDMGTVVALPSRDDEDPKLLVEIEGEPRAYAGEQAGPLELAYAVTIHKSQGSEYPAVVIPWVRGHAHMLTRNLLYTAITRGKRMVVLVTEPRAIQLSLRVAKAVVRRTTLAARLRRLAPG